MENTNNQPNTHSDTNILYLTSAKPGALQRFRLTLGWNIEPCLDLPTKHASTADSDYQYTGNWTDFTHIPMILSGDDEVMCFESYIKTDIFAEVVKDLIKQFELSAVLISQRNVVFTEPMHACIEFTNTESDGVKYNVKQITKAEFDKLDSDMDLVLRAKNTLLRLNKQSTPPTRAKIGGVYLRARGDKVILVAIVPDSKYQYIFMDQNDRAFACNHYGLSSDDNYLHNVFLYGDAEIYEQIGEQPLNNLKNIRERLGNVIASLNLDNGDA